MGVDRYFLATVINGVRSEREVTLDEYCSAERAAGFVPKHPSDNPAHLPTPVTGCFGGGDSPIMGRIERWAPVVKVRERKKP